jgi:hypothetical protein
MLNLVFTKSPPLILSIKTQHLNIKTKALFTQEPSQKAGDYGAPTSHVPAGEGK